MVDTIERIRQFVLARVDEDERRAHGTGRAAARAEAHRKIVKATRSGFPEEDRYSWGWADANLWSLLAIAQIWSDHPDYNPHWIVQPPEPTAEELEEAHG